MKYKGTELACMVVVVGTSKWGMVTTDNVASVGGGNGNNDLAEVGGGGNVCGHNAE